MNIIFESVNNFLTDLAGYLSYPLIFVIAISLFLFTIFCVIISTSHSYEARLIKAIDMFNNYFIDTPQINEDNLVAFNAKMKTRKVPKQLRKQWQQFVLYREGKASEYMSFEQCVSTPIKNSTYKRDVVTMNIISYILASVSLVLNLYASYESSLSAILSHALLCPALILLLNFILTIFLDIRHNAIVSDLYSNYQYFEVNIDKATQTLPEYVDYEVLFDKNEIKKGIPILYAYLQKRAEEEQRELERARLRNVEHEKFHFDEAGVESSLVLDRAMQEAENYIAERKKYMQDMQQINAEINQEETNFREITKEYQRQMQVSKESFDNYKSQLSEASSTIESNYLKKQQQQELDRQRNLERDYDTSTDRHKKVIESYQAELTTIEGFIAEARKTLERGMMSEFKSYSNKVYDAASKAVEEREEEKTTGLEKQIQNLEEELSAKQKELDFLYGQNQVLTEKYDQQATEFQQKLDQNNQVLSRVSDEISKYNSSTMSNSSNLYQEEPVQEEYEEPVQEEYAESQQDYGYDNYQDEYQDDYQEQPIDEQPQEYEFNYSVNGEANDEQLNQVQEEEFNYLPTQQEQEEETFNYSPYGAIDEVEENNSNQVDEDEDDGSDEENGALELEISTEEKEESKPQKRRGRPRKEVQEVKVEQPKRRGRPRKVEATEVEVEQPKKHVGRPKKVEQTQPVAEVKRGRGRPKKVEAEVETKPVETKHRGRPRKEVAQVAKQEIKPSATKKGRGRPRKVQMEAAEVATEQKRGRGRPKKTETTQPVAEVKRGRGRPRKIDVETAGENIEDIDAYLREINEEIAKENAKIQKSAKALEKKAKINKKK